MANQQHREIVRDALKCEELRYALVEVCSVDDNCEIEDYSDLDILSEAIYTRSKYLQGNGFVHHTEMLYGDSDTRRIARNQFNQLNRFIKKWSARVEGKPSKYGCSSPN
tara:strand:- start:5884 stop:6210 length:327 start_codon:yes stop_codon:yes gene_type:complete